MAVCRKTIFASLIAVIVIALSGRAPSLAEVKSSQATPVVLNVHDANASPLDAVMVTRAATVCAEGNYALDATGKLGYMFPTVGVSVVRGSSDIRTPVTWRVVAHDSLGNAAREKLLNAYSVCTKAR